MDSFNPRIVFGAGNPFTVWVSGSLTGLHAHQELTSALKVATAMGRPGDVILLNLCDVDRLDALCSSRLGWAASEADERNVRFRVYAKTRTVIGAITQLVEDVGTGAVRRATKFAPWSADLCVSTQGDR